MPYVCALALLAASGCASSGWPLSSKWAMDDPDYAEKYGRPYPKGERYRRMAKQIVDARHVAGKPGVYAGGGFGTHEGDAAAGVELGGFYYPDAWLEARAGLAGMIAVDGDPSQSLSQNAFGGINLGVRAQSPTRVAPFVGGGVFAGASSYYEPADSDGVDNDDDFFIDEPGEERETNDYFAAVYPEVGVHAWLTSNWRATASASYLVTTEGRDHDFWYVGVYLARLMQPPTFSGKDGVTLDAWGGEIPEPQLLRLPPP
ncbi:MAG: hypothetical protein KDA41_07580 [Planctomycetales bacterium]|nr:hypothetical protein [Planctomycetales bacterium]